jgi:hypothetical protein
MGARIAVEDQTTAGAFKELGRTPSDVEVSQDAQDAQEPPVGGSFTM